jgi:hypothetical protein
VQSRRQHEHPRLAPRQHEGEQHDGKKAKKNLASGFSTGAPVAIGNMPT